MFDPNSDFGVLLFNYLSFIYGLSSKAGEHKYSSREWFSIDSNFKLITINNLSSFSYLNQLTSFENIVKDLVFNWDIKFKYSLLLKQKKKK